MKRFTSILLLLGYFAATSGVVISAHFCGERLSYSGIGAKKHMCGCNAGMDMSGCCKDEYLVLQIEDDQQVNTTIELRDAEVSSISLIVEVIDDEEVAIVTEDIQRPPPREKLYLAHSSLVLYG